MTLSKLRDKCHVDGAIDTVTVAFPDQYGRLWSQHVNAEYFIHHVSGGGHADDATFPQKYNPFDKDIHGKTIEMPIEFDKTLQLKPDLSTLRSGQGKGAFVLADPINIPQAPRNVLKQAIQGLTTLNPNISLGVTCGITKHKQDDDSPAPSDSGLLTQGWHQNEGIAYELSLSLRQMGIPITQIEHLDTSEHNQFRFCFDTKPNQQASDLLFFADTFCLFKWWVKHQTVANGYHANFIPAEGGTLDLQMNLALPHDWHARMHMYLPTLHSVRKVCTDDLTPIGLEML